MLFISKKTPNLCFQSNILVTNILYHVTMIVKIYNYFPLLLPHLFYIVKQQHVKAIM